MKRSTFTVVAATMLAIVTLLCPGAAFGQTPFGTVDGSFNGVPAYSNGNPNFFSGQMNFVGGIATGYRWQCPEFPTRYYLQVYGVRIGALGNASTWFANARNLGLKAYANGGTVPPQPGDVLCTNSGPGHVAVIRAVGSNYVMVIQQNWFCDARDNAMVLPMTITPPTVGRNFCTPALYTIHPTGTYVWQGWLRR